MTPLLVVGYTAVYRDMIDFSPTGVLSALRAQQPHSGRPGPGSRYRPAGRPLARLISLMHTPLTNTICRPLAAPIAG
ncbi:MAG TPA: hypothetical protein VGF67_00040 [Ktedonobacteraceae bacterium]